MWVTVLGLTDALYWDCSPREIDLCFMEYYRLQDAENARFGTIAASIFNAVPVDSKQAKKRKWLDWRNFFNPMTSQQKKRDTLAEARMDWERAKAFGSFSVKGRK